MEADKRFLQEPEPSFWNLYFGNPKGIKVPKKSNPCVWLTRIEAEAEDKDLSKEPGGSQSSGSSEARLPPRATVPAPGPQGGPLRPGHGPAIPSPCPVLPSLCHIPGQPEVSLRSRGGRGARPPAASLTSGSVGPCPTRRPRRPARPSPSRTVSRTATKCAAAESHRPRPARPRGSQPAHQPHARRPPRAGTAEPAGWGGGSDPTPVRERDAA